MPHAHHTAPTSRSARVARASRVTQAAHAARRRLAVLAGLAGLALTACSGGGATGADDAPGSSRSPGPAAVTTADPGGGPDAGTGDGPGGPSATDGSAGERRDWVAETLAGMTLEEKVGQLFVTYVNGETADTTRPEDVAANQERLGVDNGQQAVERYHLGGVIYFTWSDNLADPAQVAGLSNGLQRASLAQSPGVPLLITTDQEHGSIVRLGEPATLLPGSMALGASGQEADAREAARVAGQELRAVGITMNHAPVADVNVNPANPVIGVRSFSGDPALAAALTAAQVEGYQREGDGGDGGVVASVKHFPGHGDTDVDSHTGLPVIDHSLAEWRALDAPPFRAAVEAGVGAVMTGHLQFPALDPSGDPATLSEPILTGLLREELGYDGVVITDSLSMDGVRETYPDAEVPVRALKAGVDLLLMPPDLDLAYHAVLDAVASGELTERRIDASVRRVLTLKHQQGIVENPYADPEQVADTVGSAEHRQAAQRLTDHTTTLVRNDDGLLPLAPEGQRLLVAGTGPSRATTETLADRLRARDGLTVTARHAGTDPDAAAIDAVLAEARDADTVVVTTAGTRSRAGQAALVNALLDAGRPVVTIATDVPYDIAHYPDATTHLATYSSVPVALEAATRVLLGESEPTGTLPVMVPTADDPTRPLHPIGHGLGY
ncbi:glycoside hydrolase family 3 protein [Streptomyces sp. 4N509B]|uniref:glycoside hydrolase family 3 protein n=1 Tax=Streptomyces sp. 4N509B TaxID=3457413 RepID=UPI003FD12D35